MLDEDADWLRDEDADALGELLKVFVPEELPERLMRALRYHEYLCWLYLVDIRWPLGATAQFVHRLAKLKDFVPVLTWSESDLAAIYDRRSALVHGVGKTTSQISDEDRRRIELQEAGLRAILLAGIRDSALASVFADDDSVRTLLGIS